MDQDAEDQALNDGHDCAMSAVAAHREIVASLPPPERLSWWVGFISAAMGAALASVGEAPVRVLRSALAERPEVSSAAMRRRHTYVRLWTVRSKKKACS